MPGRGDGREMVVLCVGEDGAAGEQPVEAGRVAGAESREVIVSELVDNNRQNQFRFLRGGRQQAGEGQHANQELSHGGRPSDYHGRYVESVAIRKQERYGVGEAGTDGLLSLFESDLVSVFDSFL